MESAPTILGAPPGEQGRMKVGRLRNDRRSIPYITFESESDHDDPNILSQVILKIFIRGLTKEPISSMLTVLVRLIQLIHF